MDFHARLENLKKVVEFHNTFLKSHEIVQADGSIKMRWEHYGKQRVIAMSACNYNGLIVTGVRHWCPIMIGQIKIIGDDLLDVFLAGSSPIQGFIDQYGFFLTRKEAYVIAKAAGQLKEEREDGRLHSESFI